MRAAEIITYHRKINSTYSIVFNNRNETKKLNLMRDFDFCLNYIKKHNGTNYKFFKIFRPGSVRIVSDQTGITIYEARIKPAKK